MKLYLIHVGFYDSEIGIYEMHSNMLVAAESPKEAKEIVKTRAQFIKRNMHIDGIEEISQVDGYQIKLEKGIASETSNRTLGYSEAKAL